VRIHRGDKTSDEAWKQLGAASRAVGAGNSRAVLRTEDGQAITAAMSMGSPMRSPAAMARMRMLPEAATRSMREEILMNFSFPPPNPRPATFKPVGITLSLPGEIKTVTAKFKFNDLELP